MNLTHPQKSVQEVKIVHSHIYNFKIYIQPVWDNQQTSLTPRNEYLEREVFWHRTTQLWAVQQITWARVETCSDIMLRMKLEPNSTAKASSRGEGCSRIYIQLQGFLPNQCGTTNNYSKHCLIHEDVRQSSFLEILKFIVYYILTCLRKKWCVPHLVPKLYDIHASCPLSTLFYTKGVIYFYKTR